MNYPWGHKRRFNAYSNYFKNHFGDRIQKVSIDAGFTCPNRDGIKGRGGCTFCNNKAFNPSYCIPEKSITQQINEGIEFHQTRYKNVDKYLAYFQAYSNSYAPLDELKKIYTEALNHKNIIGIVVGTRPDCVDEEKLDYFAELSKKYYVVIEYGIESCYNRTLDKINRGHSYEESEMAIRMTADRGIRTGGHMIMGLPGESKEEMLAQASVLSKLPLDSIKFHQLQIIKGTLMAKQFKEDPGQFKFFELDEYVDFIIDFIEMINPNFLIERFAGEAPPPFNLTPLVWGLRYYEILQKIENRMAERDTWQGKKYS